jgi:hypothetical protein
MHDAPTINRCATATSSHAHVQCTQPAAQLRCSEIQNVVHLMLLSHSCSQHCLLVPLHIPIQPHQHARSTPACDLKSAAPAAPCTRCCLLQPHHTSCCCCCCPCSCCGTAHCKGAAAVIPAAAAAAAAVLIVGCCCCHCCHCCCCPC